MNIKIICLGVGSSSGSPVLGCQCPTCLSTDPRNHRTRSSAFIAINDRTHLLIDTGPDLRQQTLRHSIQRIDAVLYTHPHADHLHGVDDLRAFCFLQKAAIPIYGNDLMMSHIEERFAYLLSIPTINWDKPAVIINRVVDRPFILQDIPITPIPVVHGRWSTLGFRINNMAYITDVSCIPETSYALLQGLDVLLLSCLRPAPHPTHFGVEAAMQAAHRIAAKKTVFIHMTHELEYHAFSQQLPQEIEVGYDGMTVISS